MGHWEFVKTCQIYCELYEKFVVSTSEFAEPIVHGLLKLGVQQINNTETMMIVLK